jgi:hypothetical protein
MSMFGSLIGGVMTWRSRSFARTAAIDSGSVATASACLATTAAPMNMGMRQMMFGFLARWNATMATPIEEEPLAIGRKHLARQGWSPGAHLR